MSVLEDRVVGQWKKSCLDVNQRSFPGGHLNCVMNECQFTRQMVENGTYMSRSEAFLVDSVERGRLADQIFYFFRDGIDELPETLEIRGSNYPDSQAHLAELLSTHEGRQLLAEEMLSTKKRVPNSKNKKCKIKNTNEEQLPYLR